MNGGPRQNPAYGQLLFIFTCLAFPMLALLPAIWLDMPVSLCADWLSLYNSIAAECHAFAREFT